LLLIETGVGGGTGKR